MPVDRMRFTCWSCNKPQADDARHWLAGCDDSDLETKLSPGGNPMMCCRVKYVGTVPTDSARTGAS